MKHQFTATIKLMDHWHYVTVPMEYSQPLKCMATSFGFIPITATVGNTTWTTSLMPMGDGSHFIALPAKVRKKETLILGDYIQVQFKEGKD